MAGPGTEIKRVLESFGITAHSGCGCTELASEMDRIGVDKLEKEIDRYSKAMHESVKRWRGDRPIPTPPLSIIKLLITYGIRRSRNS